MCPEILYTILNLSNVRIAEIYYETQHVLLTYETAPVQPTDSVFTVPFARDREFVGREDILGQIEVRLQQGRRVSLSCIGGIGYEF